MIPAAYDIQARRNADYQETFDLTVDGAPFDLTPYTMAMQVRPFGDAPDPALISIGMAGSPTAEGIWIANPATGQFTITILRASLDVLVPTNQPVTDTPSRYVYDLVLIAAAGGLRSVPFAGNFLVALGVTV